VALRFRGELIDHASALDQVKGATDPPLQEQFVAAHFLDDRWNVQLPNCLLVENPDGVSGLKSRSIHNGN
jgi:hypothetical protein